MIKNERLWRWFDAGKIKETLRGSGDYFIPDVTFRESHDLLLVIRQLLFWAHNDGQMEKAVNGFQGCIQLLFEENDLSKLIDLYMTYLIVVANEKDRLTIDEVGLRLTLVAMIQRQGNLIARNETLRMEVMRFLDRFPELKDRIGL